MSARHYFDLRGTIPGFAFVLIVIAINFVPLSTLLEQGQFSEVFGVFLAFLSLFSGSAIGFLVSQAWWWYWQNHFGILKVEDYYQAIEGFCKKFDIKKPECNARKKREFITAMNYAIRANVLDKEKAALTAAERRWDLFHTLSATYVALSLGLMFGLLGRLLLAIVNNDIIPYIPLTTTERVVIVFATISCGCLILIIRKSAEWNSVFSASIFEALIRTSNVTKKDMQEAFPSLYE